MDTDEIEEEEEDLDWSAFEIADEEEEEEEELFVTQEEYDFSTEDYDPEDIQPGRFNTLQLLEQIERQWGYRFGDLSLDMRTLCEELRHMKGWPKKNWGVGIYYQHSELKKPGARERREALARKK